MNRHLLWNWRRRVGAGDTIICLGDVAHPDAWRDDRLVLDLAECPGEPLLALGNFPSNHATPPSPCGFRPSGPSDYQAESKMTTLRTSRFVFTSSERSN